MQDLRAEFERKQTLFGHLRGEALYIIERALQERQIKIHGIYSRVKTLDSFLGKAQRKGMSNPLEEMYDIVGLRVVCLFLGDLEKLREIIQSEFSVVKEDNKIDGFESHSFGYMSVHFVVKLSPACSGPRYDAVRGIPLEIQLRTIAMDAWASVSHYLDYKSEAAVPSDLRRDFYALSGLFYVADKHFEMFFRAREQSSEESRKQILSAHPDLDQEVNLDTLSAYMQRMMPDRKENGAKDISDLVEVLKTGKYVTLRQVDEAFRGAYEAFLQYEREYPPGSSFEMLPEGPVWSPPDRDEGQYARVGVIRQIVELWDPVFHQISAGDFFEAGEEAYERYRHLIKR